MNFKRQTPLILCSNVAQVRDFYQKHFALQVTIDLGWFVGLQSKSEAGPLFELSLMEAGHPTLSLPKALSGPTHGMILAFEVEDVAAEFERLGQSGVKAVSPVVDHPWGQRNFCVEAPDGNTVDLFQSIAPDPEWLKAHGLA